jgi:hypothetical protein
MRGTLRELRWFEGGGEAEIKITIKSGWGGVMTYRAERGFWLAILVKTSSVAHICHTACGFHGMVNLR